jgi:hypothetical protein
VERKGRGGWGARGPGTRSHGTSGGKYARELETHGSERTASALISLALSNPPLFRVSPAAVCLEHGVVGLALEVVPPHGAVPPVEEPRRQDRPVRVARQQAVGARLPAARRRRSGVRVRRRLRVGERCRRESRAGSAGFWGADLQIGSGESPKSLHRGNVFAQA